MTDCTTEGFNLETERILSKQRYDKQFKKSKREKINIMPQLIEKSKSNGPNNEGDETIHSNESDEAIHSHSCFNEGDELTHSNNGRREKLLVIWKEESHRYIYDPFTCSVNFTRRGPPTTN